VDLNFDVLTVKRKSGEREREMGEERRVEGKGRGRVCERGV